MTKKKPKNYDKKKVLSALIKCALFFNYIYMYQQYSRVRFSTLTHTSLFVNIIVKEKSNTKKTKHLLKTMTTKTLKHFIKHIF